MNQFGKGNDEGVIFGEDYRGKIKMLKRTTLACDTTVSRTLNPKGSWFLPAQVISEEDEKRRAA